jgi:hypothetical protein
MVHGQPVGVALGQIDGAQNGIGHGADVPPGSVKVESLSSP